MIRVCPDPSDRRGSVFYLLIVGVRILVIERGQVPIDRRCPDRDRRAGFRVSAFHCSGVHRP